MNEIVQRVRRQYEKYPYPHRAPGVVADVHPHLLLSYVKREPSDEVVVLDAGCGTGTAALGTALCNPSVRVVAADLNRVALERLRSESKNLGLANLEVLEVDLTTLEGLPTPEGGFDVIFSSGVVHHLPDPLKALKLLSGRLAPDGVMRLMVYGRMGRQAVYRFARALDLLAPNREMLEERLALGRRLMQSLTGGPVLEHPWEGSASVDDSEFVDRYLHLQDESFEVAELMELIDGAGLRFLRWHEPREWRLESVCPGLELDLEPMVEARVVELLANRPRLDAILVRPEARARGLESALGEAMVALSPQVVVTSCRTKIGAGLLPFVQTVRVREGPEQPLAPAEGRLLELAAAGPRSAASLLAETGLGSQVVERFLAEEILYLA